MKKLILLFIISLTAVLTASASADAVNVCLFEDDAEEWKNSYYRKSEDGEWFTFKADPLLFHSGQDIIYSTQINNSDYYKTMKYRLNRVSKNDDMNFCISYNSNFDESVAGTGHGNSPYISYIKPSDKAFNDHDEMIVESVFCSTRPGGRICFNLKTEDKDGNESNTFYNFVTFNPGGTIYAGGIFLGQWTQGEEYKVTLIFRKGSADADIYINGYPVCMDYNFVTDAAVADINKVYWYADFADDTSGELYIDDIKIYSGSMPKILPFGKFNLAESADTLLIPNGTDKQELLDCAEGYSAELSDETAAQDSVLTVSDGIFSRKYKINVAYNPDTFGVTLINNNFENRANPYSGISKIEKSNTFKLASRGVDNHCIQITKTNTSDCHIDAKIDKQVSEFIMQTEFMFEEFGTETDIFRVRDATTDLGGYVPSQGVLTVSPEGVMTANGTSLNMQLELNKWYKAAARINILTKKADLYINGEMIAENYDFTKYNMNTVTVVRFWLKSGYDTGCVSFDNIAVYEAKAPCDVSRIPYKSIFLQDNDETIAYINENVMLHTRRGIVSKYGNTSDINCKTTENGKVYIYKSELEDIPGISISSGELIDGIEMVDLTGTLSENNIEYYDDGRGLIVIGGQESDADIIYRADDYLFFERPSDSAILDIFNTQSNQHPRIIADKAAFEAVKNNSALEAYVNNIIKTADEYLTYTPVKYEKTDGMRILTISRTVLNRMEYFGFAYRITGDTKYSERAWKEFLAVADFPDWNEGHVLDVGEMIAAVAICYDWMYDALSDGQRKYIEETMIEKGMRYVRDAYYGKLTKSSVNNASKFATWKSNFNIVVNSGVTLGALALFDKYPEMSSDIIEQALLSTEYGLQGFAPDGGWQEGVMYWCYTMKYFSRFISSLETSLDTDFRIMDYAGIDKTAQWAFSLDSINGFNAFHDSVQEYVTPWIYSFFANETDKQQYYDMREYVRLQYNRSYGIYDLLWLNSHESDGIPDIGLDMYTKWVESVSMREGWTNKNEMYFSAHAGPVECYHSHADCGAFVFGMSGEEWFFDLGKEHDDITGTPYRHRTEGHNTISINGNDQQSDAIVTVEEYNFFDNCGYAIYDMTPAYSDYAASVKRGFAADDGRRSLVVRDEIELLEENDVYCFMHTDAEISIDGDTAVLTKNGKQLKVDFAINAPSYEISVMDAIQLDPSLIASTQNANEGIQKIAVKMSGSGKMVCEAKISMSEDELVSPKDISLAEWNEYYNNSEYLTDGIKQNDNNFSFTVENKFSDDNVQVIICEYDLKGEAVSVTIEDADIKKGESKTFSRTLSSPENSMKVFVFDSINSLMPKAKVYETSV